MTLIKINSIKLQVKILGNFVKKYDVYENNNEHPNNKNIICF